MTRFILKVVPLPVILALYALPAYAEKEHEGSLAGRLIEPLGIATFCLLATTLILGLIMKRNRKVFFKWHRIAAFVTLGLALCHAALIALREVIK